MKLKDGFVTQMLDGNQIMIATGTARFAGLVRSNETGAFIINCLKQEMTESEIVDRILQEYDADRKSVEEDVREVIVKLRSIGAIEE